MIFRKKEISAQQLGHFISWYPFILLLAEKNQLVESKGEKVSEHFISTRGSVPPWVSGIIKILPSPPGFCITYYKFHPDTPNLVPSV